MNDEKKQTGLVQGSGGGGIVRSDDRLARLPAHLRERISGAETRLSSKGYMPGGKCRLVILADTTGSMHPYNSEVSRGIKSIIADIQEVAGGSEICVVLYKDHGHEGENNHYLTLSSGFSSDAGVLDEFLNSPQAAYGAGGGGAEALECALKAASELLEGGQAGDVIVNIGDQPPHEPESCAAGVDWHSIVADLAKRGVPVHNVLCNNRTETEASYRSISQQTEGKFLPLTDIASVTDLLVLVAGRATGRIDFAEAVLKRRHQGALSSGSERLLLELKKK